MVRVGVERLVGDRGRWRLEGARVGLLLNSASVDRNFRLSRDVVAGALGTGTRGLVSLFSPQHGLGADVQDNMVESPHGTDRTLGIPVWSLYSDTRKPAAHMLDRLDVVLIDLQDVGTRVYTFAWTVRLTMEACGEAGVRVVLLDRPNPLGGVVEGNRLRPEWTSFVGLEPVPMRHGLTLGELALWFQRVRGVCCDLEVVPMQGWQRHMLWPDTDRPWVLPSPNMPTFDTAVVYPGTVLFEGTNASEGRGTTRPFEIVGGPWGRAEELAGALGLLDLPGVVFRPVVFRPTFQKWSGRTCGGVQLHVTDRRAFRPYRTGLALLRTFWDLYADRGFGWREPPYEYEAERLPIHLLLGDDGIREALESGADLDDLERQWAGELREWYEEAGRCLLYGPGLNPDNP